MKTATFAQNLLNVQSDLLNFAYKLTADYEDANDLLQETSLKALDNEEKYTEETNFKGWVYTIMRNIFINNYRKTLRDQTYVDQTDNSYFINKGFDLEGDSTEGAYDLKEMRRIVNSLPNELRLATYPADAGVRPAVVRVGHSRPGREPGGVLRRCQGQGR